MAVISIDLRTKIVRPDTKIWRVFPGRGYEFLEKYIEDSQVFLDIPGGIVLDDDFENDNLRLRNIVKRANAIGDYFVELAHFRETGEGSAPSRPTNNLAFYEEEQSHRRIGNGVSAMVAMFRDARKGDLIVMPEHPRERAIRIGEFSGDLDSRETISFEPFYPGYQVSSRPVKWLARIAESQLPRNMTDALRHQVPISDLGNEHILNILDFAYTSYLYGNDVKGARVNTTAAEFNEQDNLDLSILIKICSKVAWEWAKNDEITGTVSESIFDILPDEAKIYISSNIHSPGYMILKGSTFAPLLFSALLTLCLSCDNGTKPSQHNIVVRNSTSTDDPSPQTIQEMLRQHMAYMGESDWEEVHAMGKRLKVGPRLSVGSRGTIRP